MIPFILARVATSATRVATNATAHTHLIAFPASSAATFHLPKLPSCTNNRCRSADLGCAMTRMSNKLVYHFLPFNEPPAGVNRRGATLTRFLSSTHCIYGRDMGGIYIWEGYEEYMGGARKLKTLHAGFDLPSHPSLSTLF